MRNKSKTSVSPAYRRMNNREKAIELVRKAEALVSGKSMRYKIFEGYDHYNGYELYRVTGTNNDYVGEWHTDKNDAKRELKGLIRGVASKNLIGKRKVRESARNYTLLKDVRTKKGVEFSKGESLKLVKYGSKHPYGVKFQDESGNQIVLIAETAHKKLRGFPKPPSFNTMEKWMSDGVAKSIDGKRVEPDGFSSSGAPSWLLALGLI